MNKLILTSFMMCLFFFGFSQSKFEIKKIGSQYSSEQLTAAFSSADFCGSFFQTKRNLIIFNDGSEVELKSASELTASGIQLPVSCVISDEQHFFISVWSIGENNTLMKGFNNETYPSEKEYYHFNNLKKQ